MANGSASSNNGNTNNLELKIKLGRCERFCHIEPGLVQI